MKKTAVQQAQDDLNHVRRELAEAVIDVKGHLSNIAHLSPWVREYPKSTFAVAFTAGFLAGRYVTPKGLVNGLAKASEIALGSIVKSTTR